VSNQVIDVYNQLDKEIQSNPILRSKLHGELSRLVSSAYTQSMNSDEGYCFKFTLPITSVMNLYKLLNVDQAKLKDALQNDWNFPNHAVMYNDPYYHILILLIYYGIRNKDEQLVNNSLMLLLQKLWNGRKYVYIKYCDKRIMNYVVNHMVNKKHNVANYDTPLALLKDYFIPTLLKKYQPEILKDSLRLKQLFMQSWVRIDQMFAFNPVVDMQTGLKRAQGGLLPMYMKAKQEGLYQSTPTVMSGDSDEDPSFDQYSTLHNRDSIISATTDYIVMNSKPQYSQSFIDEVNKNTKVSTKIISQILVAIHNHNYYDLIRDSVTVILSRVKVSDKSDICKPTFLANVKRNVISSKNTDEIRKLQKLLGMLSETIFTNTLKLDYNKYGKAQQIQIQNVILFCLIHNLQKYNCK
jgi:hypothetical protein